MQASLPEQILDTAYTVDLTVYLDNNKISFTYLSEEEANFMKVADPVAQKISTIIAKGHIILSSIFCSYFIVSLLSFWNLCLIYNFINLDVVPHFLTNFL